MTDLQLFRRWLESWWKEHHPAGGGEPPTLKEAFIAGMETARVNAGDENQERPLLKGAT